MDFFNIIGANIDKPYSCLSILILKKKLHNEWQKCLKRLKTGNLAVAEAGLNILLSPYNY